MLPEQSGEVNAVKKTDEPGGKTGSGEKQCAQYQGMFENGFHGTTPWNFVQRYAGS